MSFENPAGSTVTQVTTHYGPRSTNQKFGGTPSTKGVTKEMEYEFSYDDLPGYGTNKMIQSLPLDAFIVSARLHVTTAFAGGTSYNIGLYQSDGTVIDADGIDAAVLTAALTEDAWIVCDGALVGAGIGGAVGQLVVAATGTFTAGTARLFIEYISDTE